MVIAERRDAMEVLGVMIDEKGDTETAIMHRWHLANKAFAGRQGWLCSKRLAWRTRVSDLICTVDKTLMWGAGGWTFTKQLAERLAAWEMRRLRQLMNIRRKPTE
eukprot:5755400-Karenia_brevis.AAC.1